MAGQAAACDAARVPFECVAYLWTFFLSFSAAASSFFLSFSSAALAFFPSLLIPLPTEISPTGLDLFFDGLHQPQTIDVPEQNSIAAS